MKSLVTICLIIRSIKPAANEVNHGKPGCGQKRTSIIFFPNKVLIVWNTNKKGAYLTVHMVINLKMFHTSLKCTQYIAWLNWSFPIFLSKLRENTIKTFLLTSFKHLKQIQFFRCISIFHQVFGKVIIFMVHWCINGPCLAQTVEGAGVTRPSLQQSSTEEFSLCSATKSHWLFLPLVHLHHHCLRRRLPPLPHFHCTDSCNG